MVDQRKLEMSTRICKNCGELPLDRFTPELRTECRACYNSKRRQKNTLGSEQLKHGTWIETSRLENLYAQIQTLQAQVESLITDRSLVDQQLQVETSAKEQSLTHNIHLQDQILALRAQISTLTSLPILGDRPPLEADPALMPAITQLKHQVTESTHQLTRLETLTRETQTQMSNLQRLITYQPKEILAGEKISKQLATLTQLLADRPLIDQIQTLMAEQLGPFQSTLIVQSAEITRLQQLIQVTQPPLLDRSLVDQLVLQIENRLQPRDLQFVKALSQSKLQTDQILPSIPDRSVVDQKAPNSTPRTPPPPASLGEDPLSADPSTVTVHPDPMTPLPSPPISRSLYTYGPKVAHTIDQLQGPQPLEPLPRGAREAQAHGLPLSIPPTTGSAKKSFPDIKPPRKN